MSLSTRSRTAIAVASLLVALGATACSTEEPVTSATAVPEAPGTSLVTPTDVPRIVVPDGGEPSVVGSETPEVADQDEPLVGQPMTTAPNGSVYPYRPGSDEVQVDLEPFRGNGGGGPGFYFRSPTGNVSCGMYPQPSSVGYVGCQARESVAPEGGEVCTNAPDNKYAVRDEGAGAIHYCTNQGYFTGDENIRTLQYGEVLVAGTVYCVSKEEGVSCALSGSNAFLMSRDQNYTYR